MGTYNSKALDLDVLEHSTSKVTLGFKCSPLVKLTLAREAERLGITLSALVESIVMNREQLVKSNVDSKALQATVDTLKGKINFYENDLLKKLFNDNTGKPIQYLDAKGDKKVLTVNSLNDAYTVMINSFKTDK